MGREQFKMLWVYSCVKFLYHHHSINNWEKRLPELETETGISVIKLRKYLNMTLKCALSWIDSKGNLFFYNRKKLFNHFNVEGFNKKYVVNAKGRMIQVDCDNYAKQIQKILYNDKVSYEQFLSFTLELKQDQKIYAAIERVLIEETDLKPRELQRRSSTVFKENAEQLRKLVVRNKIPSLYLFLQDIAKTVGYKRANIVDKSPEQRASKLVAYLGAGKIARSAYNPKLKSVAPTANHYQFKTGILQIQKHEWVVGTRRLMEEAISGTISDTIPAESIEVREKVKPTPQKVRKREKEEPETFTPFIRPYEPTCPKVREQFEKMEIRNDMLRLDVKQKKAATKATYYEFATDKYISMETIVGATTIGQAFPEFVRPLTSDCYFRTYQLTKAVNGERQRINETEFTRVSLSVTRVIAALINSVRKAYQRDKYFKDASFKMWVDKQYSSSMKAIESMHREINSYAELISSYNKG